MPWDIHLTLHCLHSNRRKNLLLLRKLTWKFQNNSPEVENIPRIVLIHKHIFTVVNRETIQNITHGLYAPGKSGFTRACLQTWMQAEMCLPHHTAWKPTRHELGTCFLAASLCFIFPSWPLVFCNWGQTWKDVTTVNSMPMLLKH
jgi:hypothetical protein